MPKGILFVQIHSHNIKNQFLIQFEPRTDFNTDTKNYRESLISL